MECHQHHPIIPEAISTAAICLLTLYAWHHFREYIWDTFTVSVEFTDRHLSKFNNVVKWLGTKLEHPTTLSAEEGKQHAQGLFYISSHVWGQFTKKKNNYGADSYKLKGEPGYGTTFFQYQGRFFRIIRTPLPTMMAGADSCATLKISTLKWNADLLKTLLLEASESDEGSKLNKTTVFAIDYNYLRWMPLGHAKSQRTTQSVLLTKGLVDQIVKDVQSFLDSREWYEVRNIPHRRGYLLYGPPGCGKTSMVRAIAGEFKQDICSLSLSSKGLTDDILIQYLNKTPKNSLILIEDVDCAFKSRLDSDATVETNLVLAGGTGSLVTFRGLLNALDGVASCDGKVVFLTTNHPEKLDPALTRPGRVDVKILVDYPNEEQLGRFFCRFYPEATEEVKRQFLGKLKNLERKVSMAMVQGLFMMYKEKGQDAVEGSSTYFEEQFKILPKDDNANLYI